MRAMKSRVWLALGMLAGCGAPSPVEPRVTDDAGHDAGVLPTPPDTGTPPVDVPVPRDTATPPDVVDAATPMPPRGPCARGDEGPRDRTMTVTSGGIARSFLVHLPTGWDGRTARQVVLNFHGRTNTAAQQNLISGMTAVADRHGFLAVHPQGLGDTWNAGLCCGEAQARQIDDVAFTGALLDALEGALCIDTRRVYALGFSNGGFLSHRLGCALAPRIAAIASVAGTNLTTPCTPSRAMPVLHIHGTADAVVPYAGYLGVAGVDRTMAEWAARNGCGATPSPLSVRGDVTCVQWTGCRDRAGVRRCSVQGGGHQWPGGMTIPLLGANTTAINASEEAWQFFSAYALP